VPSTANQAWNLESFLDSLIIELDKAQDTLSYKGITRRLTYTVKDVGLDLQIFPQFDGRKVRFVTAQPGEAGSSKISIQLGSISDRQIREATKEPPTRDEILIEDVEGLDNEVKESLKKVGIRSSDDLEQIERRNLDVDKVVKEKTDGKAGVDYGNLANLINQARRRKQFAPRITKAGLSEANGRRELLLGGRNLVVPVSPPPPAPPKSPGQLPAAMSAPLEFPIAALDGERVPVLHAAENSIRIAVPDSKLRRSPALLQVALDPYAVITMEVKP
jgi:hypothetical protein